MRTQFPLFRVLQDHDVRADDRARRSSPRHQGKPVAVVEVDDAGLPLGDLQLRPLRLPRLLTPSAATGTLGSPEKSSIAVGEAQPASESAPTTATSVPTYRTLFTISDPLAVARLRP